MNGILDYIKESPFNVVILKHKTLPIAKNDDFSLFNVKKEDSFEIRIQNEYDFININAWIQFEYEESEKIIRNLCDDIDTPSIDGGCGGGSLFEYLLEENAFSRFYKKLNFEEWEIYFEKDE